MMNMWSQKLVLFVLLLLLLCLLFSVNFLYFCGAKLIPTAIKSKALNNWLQSNYSNLSSLALQSITKCSWYAVHRRQKEKHFLVITILNEDIKSTATLQLNIFSFLKNNLGTNLKIRRKQSSAFGQLRFELKLQSKQ